jgi:hypothetical protein
VFDTFILVLFYRYDRVTASLWSRYLGILLGEGLQLAYARMQIILWLRNANCKLTRGPRAESRAQQPVSGGGCIVGPTGSGSNGGGQAVMGRLVLPDPKRIYYYYFHFLFK